MAMVRQVKEDGTIVGCFHHSTILKFVVSTPNFTFVPFCRIWYLPVHAGLWLGGWGSIRFLWTLIGCAGGL